MKHHPHLLLASLAFVLMLCGCRSEEFKVEIDLSDLGSESVRVVYNNDQGIVDQWYRCNAGQLKLKGAAGEMTVVSIFNSQMRLIAHFTVENGDKIILKGKAAKPCEIKIEGNKTAEKWQEFVNKNSSLYAGVKSKELNDAIEEFVADNPDEMVSALLVLYDYTDLNQDGSVERLLDKISDKAKPVSMLANYNAVKQLRRKSVGFIGNLTLVDEDGVFSPLVPAQASRTLICLWDDATQFKVAMQVLGGVAARKGDRLQFADICIDADSALWRRTLAADSTACRHYWAPDGPLHPHLKPIAVTTTPFYVIADSAGHVVYQGTSLDKAAKMAGEF